MLLQRNLTFSLKSKIRSPLLKKTKKSRTENISPPKDPAVPGARKQGITSAHTTTAAATSPSCSVVSPDTPDVMITSVDDTGKPRELPMPDEAMPLKKGLKSRSSENLSRHQITNNRHEKHRSSFKQKDENPICNLPLPLSLTLGISSLSDSKLYSYHNSQEFLTFLTKSARDVEEAERNHTIDTALSQIKELTNLVEENSKLLRFVQNTQEYNPSSEIDDVMVYNITKTLSEHRSAVDKMCERAKQYKVQLILAESDLDTNNARNMKSDLLAMNKTLSWMSMIIRYHTWGSNVADESLYHSDDDVINQHRKLGRRNCIRVRERPKWSEETTITITPPKSSGKQSSGGQGKQSYGQGKSSKQTVSTGKVPGVKLTLPSSKQTALSRISSNVNKKNKG